MKLGHVRHVYDVEPLDANDTTATTEPPMVDEPTSDELDSERIDA